MASFMGPGWLQALSALGYAGRGYNEGQDSGARRALMQQQIQEQQRKQQMEQQLAAALFSGGGQRLAATNQGPQLPGGGGQMPPMGGGGMQPQPQQGPDPAHMAALGQALGGGGLAPGFSRDPSGGLARNGRPPDTTMPGGTPAWQEGPPTGGGDLSRFGIPPAGTPQRERLKQIIYQDESGGRNIPQGVVGPGGGFNPSTGTVTGPSSASGYGQITDSTWRDTETGRSSGYRRAIDAPFGVQDKATDELLDKRGLSPWAPYNKKLKADTDSFLKGLDLSPEFYKPAQTAANQITNSTPIGAMGTLTLDSLVQQINQRMPDASPQVKLAGLQFLMPLMSQQSKDEWEKWRYFDQKGERAAQDTESRRRFDTTERRLSQGTPELVETPGGPQLFNPKTNTATPANLPPGSGKFGATPKASRNIEVLDAEGKSVFSGAARETPTGWVNDSTGAAIQVPQDGSIKIVSTAGAGRQAAAQIQSMIGASTELVGDLNNLMELPSTSVAGIFQGLQAIPAHEMGEALKRTMANKITPEEQTDLVTSFQGVARSLATIEAQGRATGLVGLTGMSQQLMPQTGDTTGNILRKMAQMRQIMDRNTHAIETAPGATEDQKKFLKGLREEVARAVPFTVSEVNKIQHGDVETMQQAAKRFGLGTKTEGETAGGAPQGSAGFQEGDTGTNQQTGEKWMFRNGKWEKAPAGAVDTVVPGGL